MKPNFACNDADNFSLKGLNIAKIAFIAVRPEVLVSWFLDQLNGNTLTITAALDRSLKDRIYVKQPGNLLKRLVGISKGFCRRLSKNPQAADLIELRRQDVRKSSGECILTIIVGGSAQRQDR